MTATSAVQSSGHPAAEAWRRLRPDEAVAHIEDLKGSSKATNGIGKRLVSRLRIGTTGSAVIAKYGRSKSMFVEQAVYSKLLGVPAVRTATYLGSILDEPDPGSCWIFLCDVGGIEPTRWSQALRRDLASWLGCLHSSCQTMAPDVGLSIRLEDALGFRISSIAAKAATTDRRPVFDALLEALRAWERAWTGIQPIAALLPETLTHGDIAMKNMRVVQNARSSQLVVFDWGKAAWTSPLADLVNVDLQRYRAAVLEFGLKLSVHDLLRCSASGRFLRYVAAIDWQMASWPHHWSEGSEDNLFEHLAGAVRALNLVQAASHHA